MDTFSAVLDVRNNFTSIINDDEDYERLIRCWKIQDCGHCVGSNDNCGWCPYSSTCVPLPQGGNLLSPVTHPNICPMPWQERWELRSAPFGCNCSTTSLLVAIITVLSTLVGLALLVLLIKIVKWIWVVGSGRRGGWVIHVKDDGTRRGHIWVRRSHWWNRLWRGQKEEEVMVIDAERRPLLG